MEYQHLTSGIAREEKQLHQQTSNNTLAKHISAVKFHQLLPDEEFDIKNNTLLIDNWVYV